jgi:hypothetical protein
VSGLLTRVLFAGLVVVLFLEIASFAPHSSSVVVVVIAAWMVLPGVALGRVIGSTDQTRVFAWLVGPALALGFSVFGTFLWWAMGLQGWLALSLGPALTWGLVFAARRLGPPALRLPTFDGRDRTALAVLLLIVPLVTWLPYAHVREPVADGEAYRAYFTADFIWAMTVTSEIAKGDVPPHNPFLRDEPLRYYWLAHFLSGAIYRNLATWGVRLETVILLNGLLFSSAFVAFMYALTRLAGAGAVAGGVAVAVGFLANSYEGADLIRAIVQHGLPWAELANTNIDAVTRWFYHGMAVDGLQRLLLYQPHHLTGYAMALAALWLVGVADDVTATSVALLAGILLAMALLFSTFSALIVGPAVGLVFVLRLVQQRSGLTAALQCGVLGGVPIIVGVAITSAFGYADQRHGFLLQVGVNPVAIHDALTGGGCGATALRPRRWCVRRLASTF